MAQTIEVAGYQEAREKLDVHLREIIKWHFSEETGCNFWLNWKKQAGWDPISEVRTFDDINKFPHFEDEWLRDVTNTEWVPKLYKGMPFKIFETGGTTGVPKQRIAWEDHLHDYTEFSETLEDEYFPKGGNWLMVGPTGPRRLRLAIEHLANIRGGSCYFVDMDPRFVKKLIRDGEYEMANKYKAHVVEQTLAILKNRPISCLFTTPKILEALGERCDVVRYGIKGVFCGGTSMTPQLLRFLQEEVLENKGKLVPTYGNTLMGLACSEPLTAERNYEVIYHAPQPRAVLRIVDPDETENIVEYGEWGRVELTTLTKEIFVPRFLERDEALRCPPVERWPWDGVGGVRPFGASKTNIVEGVY